MQTLKCNERYTDKGQYAVVTRTKLLDYARMNRIAAHLSSNAEDLAFSTNPPIPENCRIAGVMLGWALNLAPIRIGAKFDY
jgi:hypothetical protein